MSIRADKLKVAIIGSGNIGTDLMIKIMRTSQILEMGTLVGIDSDSDGLKRAAALGVATTHDGIEGLTALPVWKDIDIVFDATSAAAHRKNSDVCLAAGKTMIDLTPAAIGPYIVPVVNGDTHLGAANVNMVTCGGQATIPIVAAVSQVATVHYAEIVASIASKSAGPGTRANIDEFTETTARGIETVGGAEKRQGDHHPEPGRAADDHARHDIHAVVGRRRSRDRAFREAMVEKVRAYVPGYRLKQKVQFERFGSNNPVSIPGVGSSKA